MLLYPWGESLGCFDRDHVGREHSDTKWRLVDAEGRKAELGPAVVWCLA